MTYDPYPDYMAALAAEDRPRCGVCGGCYPEVDECDNCGGSGREPYEEDS